MARKPKPKTAGAPSSTAGRRPAAGMDKAPAEQPTRARNLVDASMEDLARALLDHLRALDEMPAKARPRRWPNSAEIGRRAAALVRACANLYHVPGPRLAELIETIAYGKKVPHTVVTKGRMFEAWCRAVRAEAPEILLTSPDVTFKASARSVAAAAFGADKADARAKDIRQWRKRIEYRNVAAFAAIYLASQGRLLSDAQLRGFTSSPTALRENLATPGEKRS